MDWDDQTAITTLDGQGYTVLEALSSGGLAVSQTHSRPNQFVCVDGKAYWVKAHVQQGLVAELIVGRLASLMRAGPMARVVRVTPQAVPSDGSCNHLLGVGVGIQDEARTVNARELGALMGTTQFPAGTIEPASRARVVVFHTWLNMGDAQVLVGLTDGRVSTIDHGDCFGDVARPEDEPNIVALDIPGSDVDECRAGHLIDDAVQRVEAISDQDLVREVSRVPIGDEWGSPVTRRLQIAKWLAYRRDKLRGVMDAWKK